MSGQNAAQLKLVKSRGDHRRWLLDVESEKGKVRRAESAWSVRLMRSRKRRRLLMSGCYRKGRALMASAAGESETKIQVC